MSGSIELDEYFALARSNMDGPTPIFLHRGDQALSKFFSGMNKATGLSSLALANYAYSSWRTASMLSITGNTHQIPPILRVALEAAIYSHLFMVSTAWRETWKARHKSKSQASKFRDRGGAAAKDALRTVSPKMADEYVRIYDNLIDFGAHPNVAAIGFSTSYQFEEGADDGMVYFSQLTGERERYFSGVQIAEVCNFILQVLSLTWPTRYQLLGVEAARIELLRQTMLFIDIGRHHMDRG